MTLAARLFHRALQEKLAFVPMGAASAKLGQQAAGPGGAPMGGAPMDPSMGGAPMDPAMAGMPPMDPAAMGGAPAADPAMAGMPPMDPAAMGGAPMDPAAGMPPTDPMGGAPMDPAMAGMDPAAIDAAMEDLGGGEPSKAGLTLEDSEIVDKITQRTMDIVRQTLEMVGKAKPAGAADKLKPEADPAATPGPVTGQPGFDPSALPGPLKLASVLTQGFAKQAR